MALSKLHSDLIAQVQQRPALVISSIALRALALDSLIRAGQMGANAKLVFPTGHPAVSGRFKSVSVDPVDFQVQLTTIGGSPHLAITPDFTIVIELFDPKGGLAYSTVALKASGLVMPLEGGNNSIKFTTPEVVVTAQVNDAPTRAQAKQSSGISDDDLLRVEGSVAYGMSSKIVRSAVGELDPIDLEKLFPAFRFGGDLKLLEIDGSLAIVPERFEFIGNTGCPKGDATAGMEITPQMPTIGDKTASWPVLSKLPQPSAIPSRLSSGDGYIAAYMPKPILDVHFGKVAPAITYRDHGNGFIEYDVELSAAIRGVTVSIDTVKMGLRVKLDFAMWGFARARIDVPCVGPVEIAQAHFSMPKKNRTADITVIVRLGVDTAARLLMLPEIEGMNLGEAEVTIQLFSKYLGMAGGEATVVGFLVDGLIGRIIAHNLPWIVFDAIKDAVNQHFFVLADMSNLSKFALKPNVGTWSGDAGSVLMGLGYYG